MKTLKNRDIPGTNHDSTQPIRLELPPPKPGNPRPACAPFWLILTVLAASSVVWVFLNLILPY